MPIFCPLKTHPQFIALIKEIGEDRAYEQWVREENSKSIEEDSQQINGLPGSEPIVSKQSEKSKQRISQARDFLKRKLTRLRQEVKNIPENSTELIKTNAEIEDISNKVENGISNKSYNEFGKDLLKEVQDSLNELKLGKKAVSIKDISKLREILEIFKNFKGLSYRVEQLQQELEPFVDKVTETDVNKFSTEEKPITLEKIFEQTPDINRLRRDFGALSDISDYIGRTIGSKIKAAQNKISTDNQHLADRIQKEINSLKEYQKKKGITGNKIYEPFIQELGSTTVLTKPYKSEFYEARDKAIVDVNSEDEQIKNEAKNWFKENLKYDENMGVIPSDSKYDNPNYKKIQDTPELKKFYDFHQQITEEAKNKLPVEIGEDFIANIKNTIASDILTGNKTLLSGLKDGLKNIIKIKSSTQGQFTTDGDLKNDILSIKYIKPITTESKSKDLGENLFKFAAAANSYNEMSDVLPEIRLLQDQIKKKEYIRSSNPDETTTDKNSNIFKMVEGYVNAQIKGENKKEEGKIKIGSTYDENGNPNGEKYILASDVVDFGLRYNSLLRIGLNPINAVTNYLIGDIGNVVEGFGGRFYKLGDLKNATKIFFKQNFNQDSTMNKLLEELNPLQELEDYEAVDRVKLKGTLSGEDLKSFMYKPQQMGEKFLQTRTMLAVMLKDGLITKNGEVTEKYTQLTDSDKKKLADKIQRLNQSIHGRYSGRDASILQQNVLFRAAIQFRKWIPAAIESRFGGKQYDNRLGAEIEGRYSTAFRLMVSDLRNTISRLQSGKLTELEIYNMKKNLFEAVILIGSLLTYKGLKGDKDDKEWRSKPGVKFALNQLNRVSGDLEFFFSPTQYTNLLKNSLPIAKTVSDLTSIISYSPYLLYDAGKEEIYQSGQRKGENKFWSRFSSLIPGLKPVGESLRIFNGVDFKEINTPNQ